MTVVSKQKWLPLTRDEMIRKGWEQPDIVLVSGDAYVDHPAFAAAMIGRVIEKQGFNVAISAQPNWKDDLRDFRKFGSPKYFFAVTSGNMDSMVNHYTANKRLRSNDAYTPGGKSGFRPDYAVRVYCRILKKLFPDTPVIIGGIEASMRRLTHYDYWTDSLLPSILADSGADLLVYGMGEKTISAIVEEIRAGKKIAEIKSVPQTAFLLKDKEELPEIISWNNIEISSHESCLADKLTYAKTFMVIEKESNKISTARIIQKTGNSKVVVNPPFPPVGTEELDSWYGLPFTRLPHPKYQKRGQIPAYEMIRYSVNIHRGCFGGCSFCTISMHQGKHISSRSEKSVLNEIEKLKADPAFKGIITDLGGPSANMYRINAADFSKCRNCTRPSCIFPAKCDNLKDNLLPLIKLYRRVLLDQDIRKVFIGSGVRYDMLVGKTADEEKKNHYREYTEQLVSMHVSGRLKVAPEHTENAVLGIIRKPSFDLFYQFKKEFDRISKREGLNQQIVPYLMSSHPGSRESDMAKLAVKIKKLGMKPEQVQDFTPTPMTLSSVIYYSGFHPYTGEKIYTARTIEEKKRQQAYFFKNTDRSKIKEKFLKLKNENNHRK